MKRLAKFNLKGQVVLLTEYILPATAAVAVQDYANKIRSEKERKLGFEWRVVDAKAKIKVVKAKCTACKKECWSDLCYECRKRRM